MAADCARLIHGPLSHRTASAAGAVSSNRGQRCGEGLKVVGQTRTRTEGRRVDDVKRSEGGAL
jgi:ribosomal protein S13